MSATAPRAPFKKIPLVMVLAGVATIELVLNRIVSRLLRHEFLQPRTALTRALDDAGLYVFQLLSVLGVMVLAAGIARVMVAGTEFRPGARASLPIVGAVFVALAGLAMFVRLPGNLVFHLHLSFLFLVVLLGLAILAAHARPLIKLGGLMLVAAPALKLVPAMLSRLSAEPRFSVAVLEVFSYAALGVIAVGALLLVPRHGRNRGAMIVACLITAAAATLVRLDWETAARVAGYGFGVELPVHPLGQAAVSLALMATSYATLSLLAMPGVHRLRGYGLMLLTLGGLSLELPNQLTLIALGFLCIAESVVRSDGKPIAREAFAEIVKRGAATLGAQQVTVTGAPGFETARINAPVGQLPLTVVLARRAGVVCDVELSAGEVPPRDPPFCLEHRANTGLGPHESGARVEVGDADFDRTFHIYDRRGAGAALLDDATRKRMLALIEGWLAVWPQRGAAYRASSLPPGSDGLDQLIALLRELAARTA